MGYTVRVLPRHRLLAGAAELGMVTLAGAGEQGDSFAAPGPHL
jgi:hypothetical protein